jgi:CrcB protein
LANIYWAVFNVRVRLTRVKQLLLVGLGGGLGAISRFQLGLWIQAQFASALPIATLAVNLIGCFLIGLLAALGEKRGILTPETRVFLVTGVLGGFTTFSAFGMETFALLRGGKLAWALLYVGLSVGGGILLVTLGWAIIGNKNPANG